MNWWKGCKQQRREEKKKSVETRMCVCVSERGQCDTIQCECGNETIKNSGNAIQCNAIQSNDMAWIGNEKRWLRECSKQASNPILSDMEGRTAQGNSSEESCCIPWSCPCLLHRVLFLHPSNRFDRNLCSYSRSRLHRVCD